MNRSLGYSIAAVIAVLLPFAIQGEPYWLDMLALLGFWAAVAGSWNLLGGYAGQISLGHFAFCGIGAYSVAIITTNGFGNALVGMLIGVALSIVAAVVIGVLTLRLRGAYFAIATIAFTQVAFIIAHQWSNVTKGSEGITVPYDPGLTNLNFGAPWVTAAVFLVCALAVAYLSAKIRPSRVGLFLRSIRDDTVAATSLGVRVVLLKLMIFALAAAIAAVMGSLNAVRVGYVDPTGSLDLMFSIELGLIVMIGGLGSPIGPLVGAAALIPLQFLLRGELGASSGPLYLAFYGLILIVILRVAPGGLVELGERLARSIRTLVVGRNTQRVEESNV